ncbi:hypothetical protein NKR23_g10594 [Pleurostoma richardsiae]|uniref:Rhodopsin domain-containing protein n=1 Tax=Pleurostoma richardsiae TaxID=41990 RepID=A0AA38R9V1_9PEZI|nr:hypothetical protein NKR23_g10594 [Pleurostoma richardsiae]
MSTVSQGEALQALAYAEPPIKPQGLALAVVIAISTLLGISTIVIAARVYARAWMGRKARVWGWEDTFSILGYACVVTSGVFAIEAAYYGLGTRDSKLNPYLQIRCAEYMLYANVMYGFSVPFIKASVVFTLLRITTDKRFHWALYAMLAVASLMALIGILASLLYCHPVKAYWNPYLGTCGDFMVVVKIGYAWTAVGIVTDWTCAILPYFVVRTLQMSKKTKRTVIAILGVGAIASTATIIRAPYLQYYLATKDQLYWNGWILLWSQVESGIGLIAAALPSLRLLFRRYLESTLGSGSRSKQYATGGGRSIGGDVPTQMDTLSPTGEATVTSGKWKRLDDESSSTKHIMQVTTVSVQTESMKSTDDIHRHHAGVVL